MEFELIVIFYFSCFNISKLFEYKFTYAFIVSMYTLCIIFINKLNILSSLCYSSNIKFEHALESSIGLLKTVGSNSQEFVFLITSCVMLIQLVWGHTLRINVLCHIIMKGLKSDHFHLLAFPYVNIPLWSQYENTTLK